MQAVQRRPVNSCNACRFTVWRDEDRRFLRSELPYRSRRTVSLTQPWQLCDVLLEPVCPRSAALPLVLLTLALLPLATGIVADCLLSFS